MGLLDKDIRESLFWYFEEKYGMVRFIEEKSIGKSRADVMLVTTDSLIGIEIKSDADTYARLKSQVRNYDRFFDYNYVVVGKSHKKHVEEHVPPYWGIVSCYPGEDDLIFELVRMPEPNPKVKSEKKISILWRRELNSICEECLKYKYTHLNKTQLGKKLIEGVDKKDLDYLISRELFNRDYTIFQDSSDL